MEVDLKNTWIVHTTAEKFENAALFQRLGPPSTLIRRELMDCFENALKPQEFENTGFTF